MTDFHALIHSYQNCACGQAHTCAIRDIEIGSGLVRSVGDILRKNGFGPRLLLAADEQTLAAAEGIEASLAGFAVVRHIWPTIRVATMQDVEKIESYFDRVDGVLAVGTTGGSLVSIFHATTPTIATITAGTINFFLLPLRLVKRPGCLLIGAGGSGGVSGAGCSPTFSSVSVITYQLPYVSANPRVCGMANHLSDKTSAYGCRLQNIGFSGF